MVYVIIFANLQHCIPYIAYRTLHTVQHYWNSLTGFGRPTARHCRLISPTSWCFILEPNQGRFPALGGKIWVKYSFSRAEYAKQWICRT
jgi:hypothetical protein